MPWPLIPANARDLEDVEDPEDLEDVVRLASAVVSDRVVSDRVVDTPAPRTIE